MALVLLLPLPPLMAASSDGCPTLALFARMGIRDLNGLEMLFVGICDFPPIDMHDGWGTLSCGSVH
jgi:hypothetical protein